MVIGEYDRTAAVEYARRWALGRNPRYFNFDNFGGDCTNFASQCLYAGSGTMNYSAVYGWFYVSAGERTASWTGVPYLYNFLTSNTSVGPYAAESSPEAIQPGDLVQLGDATGRFYHSPVVVSVEGGIRVAAHTFDVLDKPLEDYVFDRVRYLHILGVRRWR